MSTSSPDDVVPSPSPTENSVFEDLDALLQRMLALPVNQLEPAPDSASDDLPGVPLITVAEAAPEPMILPGATPLPSPALADDLYFQTHRPAEPRRPPTAPPPPAREYASPAPPAKVEKPQPSAVQKPELPRFGEPPPALLRPILWINSAFDALTARLGPVGRCLDHPLGRSILGWSGLALIVLAAGLVAWDWLR